MSRLHRLTVAVGVVVTLAAQCSCAARVAVGFEESAVVRRLPDGKMLVHFEFTNTAAGSVSIGKEKEPSMAGRRTC